MTSASLHTLPRIRRVVTVGVVGAAMGLSLLLSACGTTSSPTTGSGTPNANCPSADTVASWHLVNSGKLTIASDTTYAPAEFSDPSNPSSYIGYDMDLAREFAKRLCLQPDIIKADFGSIISDVSGPALGQQRYDMSISSFTINSDRQKKVDMIPYFTAGESILTPTGNPKNITSFETMCGKIIAAQDNTVELAELQDANGTGDGSSGQAPVCKDNKIKVVHFVSQNDVVLQVVNGSADASYQDQPVTDYFVSKNPGKLQSGGITVPPSPQGIVMRKDNPKLEQAIKDALNAMRTDGTYLKILKNWGVDKLAYPPLS
ncbi:MAG TPA: ABC transporter substrate-binding protein [Ktedonobacterales bacterium]